MRSFENVDWAVNERGELLLAFEQSNLLPAPQAFVVTGRDGYVLFENLEIIKVNIPKEILVSVVAATDILIVSLRGGAVLTEKLVSVWRG